MAIPGDPKRLFENHFKSRHKGSVFSRCPLEADISSDFGQADDPHQVIIADRMQDRNQELFFRPAFSEKPAEVTLHVIRAAVGYDRTSSSQGQAGVILEGNIQSFGLLFDKRAGSCGANIIHEPLDDGASLHPDEFRILASDLDDRVNIGVERNGRFGMGRNFVNDEVGMDQLPDKLPSRARRSRSDPREMHTVSFFQVGDGLE